jgi:hypothetical protein
MYVATPNVIKLLNVIIITLGFDAATHNVITVKIITLGVATNVCAKARNTNNKARSIVNHHVGSSITCL